MSARHSNAMRPMSGMVTNIIKAAIAPTIRSIEQSFRGVERPHFALSHLLRACFCKASLQKTLIAEARTQ